jgi:hypothetical protein
MMRRRVLLQAGLTAIWPRLLMAQPPDPAEEKAVQSVQVGDRWIYTIRDELNGHAGEVAAAVTAVSDKEYDTFQDSGGFDTRVVAFDHDWNMIENDMVIFKPNDGRGIRLPLAVGEEWQSQYEARNIETGTIQQSSVRSTVTSQEPVTTVAGTFATFRIEHHIVTPTNSTTDLSEKLEEETVIWYAPQVNRYVQRTLIVRIEGRIIRNLSWKLVVFKRKL